MSEWMNNEWTHYEWLWTDYYLLRETTWNDVSSTMFEHEMFIDCTILLNLKSIFCLRKYWLNNSIYLTRG